MSDWWIVLAVFVGLSAVQAIFGLAVSLWVASVLLAFCLGAFWGAGSDHLEGGR